MSKLTAHPMPAVAWTGMTALAVAEPILACTALLKLIQTSAPGTSEQQLMAALLYMLPVALVGPSRRALGRLLPATANRRPLLLVWTAGISSTVLTWHAAAVIYGGDRVFQYLATVVLSTTAAYSYAHLGRRTALRRVQGRHIVQAYTASMALLGLSAGGALDHEANLLGIVLGVATPVAAILWRRLVRDFTGPNRALVAAHR